VILEDYDGFQSAAIIPRLAGVLVKEVSMQRILKIIQEHQLGIPRKDLLQIVTDLDYSPSLINQVIYYGLILQTKNSELCNEVYYHLTEKSFQVLEACEEL